MFDRYPGLCSGPGVRSLPAWWPPLQRGCPLQLGVGRVLGRVLGVGHGVVLGGIAGFGVVGVVSGPHFIYIRVYFVMTK